MDDELKAIETQAPSVTIFFQGPHSTGAKVAYSDVMIDVGQLIIARELISREIEEQFVGLKTARLGIKPHERGLGLVIPHKR